ncbi:MAG: HAMP domain-containing histidine kinase, partial [Lachnospiraceae bacterium]|nr:HAMP domain-containing histidine kinase [Lachnospiraceae bacterium]
VIPFVLLYIAIAFYILRKGAKSLAEGDLSAQIETKYLVADLKAHGKDLNNIGCAVAKAVEERLKSERMKTELITNVSHDIKTPVTSIINYSDLIQKESDPDKIKEYAEVIERQSAKLKNLVEDLVEASKASTGNLEMQLMPTDVGVLLMQAVGEYEKRLKDAGLEMIINCPDEQIMIMADGRRMWRVFDNLLNNICKYSLSGTRVYLTMENKGKEVCITFRNTSRDALNIAPEELLERFTRADASRHTEGNGLGLSIAKSLTQLQNGILELAIDGDLFKAVLQFPRVVG